MPFNKTKLLDAAQKYLNQGKLAQAIGQYQEILRYEPRDQVTLMTLGDLYVRSGDTVHAVEVFQRLAQLFQSEGFTSKAIAIHKKIAKLTPNNPAPLEKLAELYAQQGIMSEARPIFLQLAEMHLKGGRNDAAAGVLRRLVELEPDNLRVQMRLADLYQGLGQTKEAFSVCLHAAQRLLDHHEHENAESMVRRALELEADNPRAAVLAARIAAAAGRSEEALELLEALPEFSGEALALMVELYLKTGRTAAAAERARQAFAAKPEHYALAFDVAVALLEGGDAEAAWGLLDEIREAMGVAGEYEKLARVLSGVCERLPGRIEPLDRLVEIHRRTGDTFRLPGVLARLGEALAAAGDLERARAVFEELVERSSNDGRARQRLNQIRAQLGLEPLEEIREPVPAALAESAPSGAVSEQWMDGETRRFVSQALTDVDLFASYGLSQKAMDLLEAVLQRVPRHTGALEKLLDLAVGAGNDRRTVELAHQLERIYREQNDAARAEHFAELRRRFQRAAGIATEDLPPPPPAPEFALPGSQPADTEVPVGGQEEAAVYELDLSEEWSSLAALAAEAAPAQAPAEKPPAPGPAGAVTEAGAVQAVPEEIPVAAAAPEPAVAVADRLAAETPSEATEPPPASESPALELPSETLAEVPATAPGEAQPVEERAAAALAAEEAVAEVAAAEEHLEYALEPSVPPAEAAPMTADAFLNELAAETGDLHPAESGASRETAAAEPLASVPVPAAAGGANGGPAHELTEVFEEFRAELGGLGEEREDLETRYNLGIAYREMGLLEEAIGEFQRVAQAVQAGKSFRYAMQCCTLLALCFMEKNQPKIAAMWYERALRTPGLDPETEMALRYDLGVALEQAGDARAALDCFTQVYAMNIDYRDVAERISALEKHR